MRLTVQELCSSVSGREAVGLIRVGEEALIESTQARTLTPRPPPPVSSLFKSFFWDMAICPPSAAGGSGTAGENRGDFVAGVSLTMPIPDVQSETSTFCLVIF